MLDGDQLHARCDAALPIAEILSGGVRRRPDIDLLATRDTNGVSILVWHYHDDAPEAGDPAARIAHFAFRARAPLFEGVPFDLCLAKTADGADLWTHEPSRGETMTAAIIVRGVLAREL